nr:arabinofuranosidase catalytic domain-containing protein [Raoultella terrigena]
MNISTTSIIAPGVEFTNYIGKGNFLGAYPDALAAYSLRKIGTRYVGPLVRIRRSSDNLEQDFYERYGSVNIDEIKAFTGTGGSAFVSVWYDQSGNGNHAFQPVAASQPVVIRTGTVILFNSKNALMFDGVDDCLQLPENVARQFNDGITDFSVFSAVIPRQVAQSFTALSLAARDSETANYNDMMLFQINAAYSGGARKSVGTLFRKATGSSYTDITAIGSGSPADNVPVFCGVTREGGVLTLNDANTTATKSGMTTAALNLSLATIGAVRRGVNGNIEAGNANSKIAELIIYKKSYQGKIPNITSNLESYYV